MYVNKLKDKPWTICEAVGASTAIKMASRTIKTDLKSPWLFQTMQKSNKTKYLSRMITFTFSKAGI